MPDAVRRRLLWSGIACLVACLLLGLAVKGWSEPRWQIGPVSHGAVYHVLRGLEVAFGTVPLLVVTAGISLALVRRHRRAAIFVAATMVTTLLVHSVIARLFDVPRPPWQVAAGEITAHTSYPSGHTSGTMALAAVLAILAEMFVRRRNLRRFEQVLLGLMVVVIALDRVLLGRHYVADVVGGVLLGGGIVLLALAIYDPLPRSVAARPLPPLDSAPRGHKLAVILNPVKVESVSQFQSVVNQLARESGWEEPTWHYTTVTDSGTGMAASAAAAGADLVMVCGGDGTVREVCAELAGTGIAVGIIPAGTGNLLARNLSIPLYVRAAIDVALNGQDRAIDLVEVSGDGIEDTHFMVMAGMGFDAAIMEGVDERLKHRIGWLAYVVSGIKGLMFPPVRLEVSIDDAPFTRHRARTVVVGNVGTLTAGMPLLPDARIDDGLLDIVMLHPQRFWSWLPLAWRILTRHPRTDALVNRMVGHTVVIRADRDTPRELDGDTLGAGRELRMRCIHGRLLVRVPRTRAE